MPTYLRNFYYKKLVAIKETEQKEVKKSQKKVNSPYKTSIPKNPRFKR